MGKNQLSKSKALAVKVIFASLNILKEKGGELSGREVIDEVEKRVELDHWAKERYEKTGYIRWQSILHFYLIDCIKAGFLVKKKGIWRSIMARTTRIYCRKQLAKTLRSPSFQAEATFFAISSSTASHFWKKTVTSGC
jgi:hypothetical protein